MLDLEVFVRKLFAVDALSADSRAVREVPSLYHEVGDDPVERGALVVERLSLAPNSLLARAERPEVLGRFRNGVAEEAHDNAAFVPVLRLHVKVNLVSDLLKVLTGYGHGLSQDGKEEERNDGDLQKHDVLASNCSARVSYYQCGKKRSDYTIEIKQSPPHTTDDKSRKKSKIFFG